MVVVANVEGMGILPGTVGRETNKVQLHGAAAAPGNNNAPLPCGQY